METRDLVWICGLALLVGLFFGIVVIESGNAVIHKPALDTLCEKVFGEGFTYKEVGIGVETELICELNPEAIQAYLVQQNETG